MVRATDTNHKLDQIQAKIADYKQWRHCIEVAPGVVTPGKTKNQDITLKKTIVIDSRFVLPNGEEVNLVDIAPQLADIPLAQFYAKQNIYQDPSVRWVTNVKGLSTMIDACRFELNSYKLTGKNRIMCACTPSEDQEEELSYQFDYVDTNARVSI